jgi:phospholipid/cholesterol/gamma-HCH transport system substrate-binding protein
VARDLQPTLRDVHALSPGMRRFFSDLDPLIDASKEGLPATSDALRGLKPTLAELGPFLRQVNPILQFLETDQFQVSDFITNGAAALADTTASPSGAPGHYLRQFGPVGAESAAMYPERLSTNRGNSYPGPLALFGQKGTDHEIFGNFDCKPSNGERKPSGSDPGCYVDDKLPGQGQFPHVEQATDGAKTR